MSHHTCLTDSNVFGAKIQHSKLVHAITNVRYSGTNEAEHAVEVIFSKPAVVLDFSKGALRLQDYFGPGMARDTGYGRVR